ncbi:hypothetical protein KDN32_12535 [Nocardioides sp. J2M5]|uniref:hypothetical protein n=1 Tax=Nocardioides palaemonis TaxID=2829810 RepID=UPI001BAB9C6E|nr:hypothetical protein [Nocardioides palaemonis]MBS2938568.1 hypothetical protein [Nocardioides palaemonis]
MRRPLTAALSLLLASGVGLTSLDAASADTPVLEKPKPTTKVVTAPVDIWKASAAQTPGGPVDYCAVTVFAVFPEVAGFTATTADYVITIPGAAPSARSDVLAAPFDDQFQWGPLARSAPTGQHQAVLGGQPFVWKAGSGDCEAEYAKAVAWYSPTVTITYGASGRCAAAINSYNAADRAVKQARKRVEKARTPAQTAAARAQLRSAKATLVKARKKYQKKC